jgi:hypothetical protein
MSAGLNTGNARAAISERGNDETWAAIPEWSAYEVSNLGSVRRLTGTTRTPRGRALRTHINSNDYRAVHLRQGGRERQIPVHVAVLSAFVGPKPSPIHQGHTATEIN